MLRATDAATVPEGVVTFGTIPLCTFPGCFSFGCRHVQSRFLSALSRCLRFMGMQAMERCMTMAESRASLVGDSDVPNVLAGKLLSQLPTPPSRHATRSRTRRRSERAGGRVYIHAAHRVDVGAPWGARCASACHANLRAGCQGNYVGPGWGCKRVRVGNAFFSVESADLGGHVK